MDLGNIIKSQEFLFNTAPFRECHASTIVESEEGSFWVSFFAGTNEGSKDVGIWMIKKKGNLWTHPKKVAWDREAACWIPVLFKDSEGKIYLFYKIGDSPESWSAAYTLSAYPYDGWSEPQYLPAGLLGPTKNKPIVMSNGEMICGSSVESYKAWACWAEVFDGVNWSKFGPIFYEGVNKGVIQPSVVELSSGKLRMFMRSTEKIGRICMADSLDYGRKWSRAKRTVLPNPNSGIDAVRLRSGIIILVYNDSKTSRTPLSLAASDDEGETWRKIFNLESGRGEFSYPSLIQASDNSVHVTYTWKRRRIRHMVLNAEGIEDCF